MIKITVHNVLLLLIDQMNFPNVYVKMDIMILMDKQKTVNLVALIVKLGNIYFKFLIKYNNFNIFYLFNK